MGNMVGVSQYSKDDLRHQDYRIGNYDPNSEQYGETDKTYREETDEIDSDGQTDHTETVIITPPTGEDRSYTYYIIGAVALMVLATGIIVIKKLVLK